MPLEVWLPLLNTALIVTSGVFLLIGFFFVKRKNISAHKASMLTAASFAGLFLVVYVTRYVVLDEKIFTHSGWVKTVFLSILIGHIILAISIVPLVLITLRRAFRGDFQNHARIARVTFPIWLVVAVSGWVIYWMLYRL